ncbi:MAG TPA: hypothetical protein VNW53_18335, partial [Phenylobacterium sp.]|uniref:hypothetical protein n=1 Tax=Phenylobacterium sp. TaxID=1871053 RepID=UPI002D1012A3
MSIQLQAASPTAPPPWSWTQIDFGATVGLVVVIGAIAFAVALLSLVRLHDGSGYPRDDGEFRLSIRPRVLWARLPSLWLLIFVALFGSALIGLAAEADPKGLFGSGTAAWVQAVGTVSAIIAAALIASQKSRQQDKMQIEAEDRAANARLGAILRASLDFEEAEKKLKITQPGGLSGNAELKTELGDTSRAMIRAAEAMLVRLLNQPANVPVCVQASLARASEVAATYRARIEGGDIVWGEVNGSAFREQIADAGKELMVIHMVGMKEVEGVRKLDERRKR